jgi:hypothetical protein
MQNVLFPTEFSPQVKAELTNASNTYKMSFYPEIIESFVENESDAMSRYSQTLQDIDFLNYLKSEYLQSDDINKLKSMVKILVTNEELFQNTLDELINKLSFKVQSIQLLSLDDETKEELNTLINKIDLLYSFSLLYNVNNSNNSLDYQNIRKFIASFVGLYDFQSGKYIIGIDQDTETEETKEIVGKLPNNRFSSADKEKLLTDSLFLTGRERYVNSETLAYSAVGILLGGAVVAGFVYTGAVILAILAISLLILGFYDLARYGYYNQDKTELTNTDANLMQML